MAELDGRQSVLDLGCGTGSLLIDLHCQIEHGTGVDISQAMIARASEKASELAVTNLSFEVCNILAVSTETSYDLVLCTDGVLPYLAGEDEIRRILQRLAKIINPDGIAILEFWTNEANVPPADGTTTIPPDVQSVDERMLGDSYLCEIKHIARAGMTRIQFHCPSQPFSYTVMKSDTGEELHRFYFIRPDLMRDVIEECGFKAMAEYGLARQNGKPALAAFNKSSKMWTVVLKKQSKRSMKYTPD